jgi:Berberine and berberine like
VASREAHPDPVLGAMWAPDEPEADRFRRWIRDAWRRLRPFSTGASYVNFQTADEGDDRVRATYGANWDRLVEVKRRRDTDNLFGPTATSDPEARPPQPRSRDGSAHTGSASTRVASTRAWPMGPAARSKGSRSRTARSASLPGVTEPVSASRRRA